MRHRAASGVGALAAVVIATAATASPPAVPAPTDPVPAATDSPAATLATTATTAPPPPDSSAPPASDSAPTTGAATSSAAATTTPELGAGSWDWQRLVADDFEPTSGRATDGRYGDVATTPQGLLATANFRVEGGGTRPALLVSADGATWTEAPLPPGLETATLREIASDGSRTLIRVADGGSRLLSVDAALGVTFVESDLDDADLTKLSNAPGGGFLVFETVGGVDHGFESADGTTWTPLTGLDEAMAAVDARSVVDVASNEQSTIVLATGSGTGADAVYTFVRHGDGEFATGVLPVASFALATARGVLATPSEFLVFGGVPTPAGPLIPTLWRSGDGTTWTETAVSITRTNNHTWFDSLGEFLIDAVVTPAGLVGRAGLAASEIFVYSPDGVTFSEIALGDQVVEPRRLPATPALAVAGDQVYAVATGDRPTMLRVTSTVDEVFADVLPTVPATFVVEGSASGPTSSTFVVTETTFRRATADPVQTNLVLTVGADGSVTRRAIRAGLVRDVWVAPDGTLRMVG